nr:FGGY-family carbohydrate kinase [Rhabdochromatium marinum]
MDVGTSGCRALAVAADGATLAEAQAELPASKTADAGGVEQQPQDWWRAVQTVLSDLVVRCTGWRLTALCLDATSATVLLCDTQGQPLGPALMYNDSRALEAAALIDRFAPPESPARGASSSLAKLLHLRAQLRPRETTLALHQADWLTGCLTGRFGSSDWHNSLKAGFDPQTLSWPSWLDALDLAPLHLPRVVAPGTDLGPIAPEVAAAIGLPADLRILAGTTDSTAAVLATGALTPGTAVTSLGSTLVLKILSDRPVVAPEYGVYSHRLEAGWLVGGASNSGGAVLKQFFTPQALQSLSAAIDPNRDSGLDYYPLCGSGERFPVNDATLAPRMQPRPASDVQFLHGLLEGIARIERAGYARLRALGAPAPQRILTIGGGAGNAVWTRLRARLLGIPVEPARQQQAAYGAARLALER